MKQYYSYIEYKNKKLGICKSSDYGVGEVTVAIEDKCIPRVSVNFAKNELLFYLC